MNHGCALPGADRVLYTNPALIVSPSLVPSYFLASGRGPWAEGFELPEQAIALLKRFCGGARLETFAARDSHVWGILGGAIEAGLLLTEPPDGSVAEAFAGFRITDWATPLSTSSLVHDRLVRDERLANGRLVVLDDIFPPSWVAAAERWLAALPYRLADYDTVGTSEIRHWSAELRPAREYAACVPIFGALFGVLSSVFPGREARLSRAHANCSLYGDLQMSHRDTEQPGLSVVFFGHEKWEASWMGEMVFFDENEEAVLAVSPRPGRVVVFDGSILHRAGVPSRLCHAGRRSLVLKCLDAPGGVSHEEG